MTIIGARWTVAVLLTGFFALIDVASAVAQISKTKHNLSIFGPGPVKAAVEGEICIFCHHAPQCQP